MVTTSAATATWTEAKREAVKISRDYGTITIKYHAFGFRSDSATNNRGR